MPCRPSARLAVIVGAGVVLAAATYTEAGSRVRGHHGLRRSSNFHQRFYQARGDLHSRNVYAGSRHLGIWRHHGLGHGGYGCERGVRRYHGLGDGFYATYTPSRYWNAVRPYYVVPYSYDSGCGYGHDGWITVGAEDYQRTSEPPVFEVVSTQRADAAPPDPKPTRSETAWTLLAEGKARAALREFAVLALCSSGDAEARAGYGLAAAMLGKHDTAVWAFRRAVITDADVLDDLARDERLTEPLRQLLDDYAPEAQDPSGDPARNADVLAANN
ncbi:MAG: hypothetical protein ACYTAU_18340 [Planctomycetota bacterium]|jgi:hypothetical protein